MRHAIALLTAGLVALSSAPAAAGDINLLGAEACVADRTLRKIVKRFAWAERNNWQRGFEIETLENPRLRYDVFNGPSMIAHTHCQAEAHMTDGRQWTVYYTVEEGMGLASIGTGVEFCVLGLDPWYVHDRDCRTLR